ncbi:MAG: hypothetical protein R3330_16925, partial [Saprospiraceae bacterium]|nr:hypothetical protein [Saprospiraceae bacterium]
SNPLHIDLLRQTDSTVTIQVAVHVAGDAFFMFQDRHGRVVHTESAMLPEPGWYEVELSARELVPGHYTLQMSAGAMTITTIVQWPDY